MYPRDSRVEVEVEVEIKVVLWVERSYFESERSELNPPGFHSCQPFQPYPLSELEAAGHSRHGIWEVEGQRLTPSCWEMSYWTFVSREGRVDKFEQLGLVRRHSHATNPNDA